MKQPFISVIIPLLKLSETLLEENLPAFEHQTFKHFEVIVLPNESSELDKALLKKYKFLKIIPTKKVTRPALKRDIGAKNAQGDILAFIDDDAHPQNGWLKNAVHVFNKKNVAAVCGPGIIPKNAPLWERVFDEVLKTKVGSGGFAYRFIKQPARYVDDYPSMNFLIKKDVFSSLGGFNNEFWPGEDSKLCEDIVYKLNEKIYYDPAVTIYHHRRNDLTGYLRQHGNYGFHRGAFLAHGDKNSRRITYLIPTFFLVYLFFLSALVVFTILRGSSLSIFIYIAAIPAILYAFLLLLLARSSYKNTNSLKISILSAIVLFLTHVIYGVRFIKGFYAGSTKKEKIYGN
ncbi:MAG: glycosyltransferase [Microgenomates group bacterium]